MQIADRAKRFLVVWPRLQHSEMSVGMEKKNTEVQHRHMCTCLWRKGVRGCCLTTLRLYESNRAFSAPFVPATLWNWGLMLMDVGVETLRIGQVQRLGFDQTCLEILWQKQPCLIYHPLLSLKNTCLSHSPPMVLTLLGNVNNGTGLVSDGTVFAIRHLNQIFRAGKT